jgi:hypothetical protein
MKRRTELYLGIILGASTLVRLALGFVYFGFHTGDDVEILQAGFMRALGWPYQPWEIRNLLVSDVLVAPALTLAIAMGVRSTQILVWLASVPFVFLASLNIWLLYRLTRRWLESEQAALLAAGLYAFHWLPLGYGSMVYPRTVSTSCVLLAAWLVWDKQCPAWRAALAGGLVGVAWAIRYSESVFLAPLLCALWLAREPIRARLVRSLALLCGFVGVSFLTVGLEDWLAWGRPFASLIAFARYTLVERQASALEPSQPWFWYLWRLAKWLPLTLLPFLWRARRVPGVLTVALYLLLPLVGLSAIYHKQLRYLQGIIPILIMLAAAGAWSLWMERKRRLVIALATLSVLWGLSGITFLQKKSMAAVKAAHDIQTLPASPRRVCLSQAWAYGDTLYLRPGVGIHDLPYPLSAEALEGALGECPIVALYQEDFRRDAGIPTVLEERGFTPFREFGRGHSKPVLVFRRTEQPESKPAGRSPERRRGCTGSP